jgi:hypothetical protein
MFAGPPSRWPVLCGTIVILACVSPARADDAPTNKQLQETITKLEKKIADLEAKVAALEKQAKAEPAKTDKEDEAYVKATAGATLDALLAGDDAALKIRSAERARRSASAASPRSTAAMMSGSRSDGLSRSYSLASASVFTTCPPLAVA